MRTRITQKQRAARRKNIALARAMRQGSRNQSRGARKAISNAYKKNRKSGMSKSASMFGALKSGIKVNKKYAGRKMVKFGRVEAKKLGMDKRNQLRIGRNYARNAIRG